MKTRNSHLAMCFLWTETSKGWVLSTVELKAERGDIIVRATLTEGTTGSECRGEMSSSSAIYPLTSCPCSSKYSHNPAHANKTN